jgi:signal transduction histidine kinase
MHRFLSNNRDELIARCKAKSARRRRTGVPASPSGNGIPLFLDELTRTLKAEAAGDAAKGKKLSGPPGGDRAALSPMGMSATAHGKELMSLGYTVDQVVHDYGDLCQAITDLAVERDAPFSVDEFRTLNRCLDNAIADAVTEFSRTHDDATADHNASAENERLGVLVHELRNLVHTAKLSFTALESGRVAIGGATSAVLKRTLDGLSRALDGAIAEVRASARSSSGDQVFSLASLVGDARDVAWLDAQARGCALAVPEVDAELLVEGNRENLLAALVNLLQNALKFTHPHTQVVLRGYADGDRIRIDIKDRCGGLPPRFAETMFRPFTQGSSDRSGLGLGLSVAQRHVEADRGALTVEDLPGEGCVFTVHLPRRIGDRAEYRV